jgi:hypothetical protein
MKKTLLLLFLLFSPVLVHAEDYWVYIRLEDRFASTDKATAGRSKKGDVVNCIPVTPQFIPTAKEKQEWAIEKWDITPQECLDLLKPSVDAYRKNKVDVDTLLLKKGLREQRRDYRDIKSNVREKTPKEISNYKIGTRLYAMARPVLIAWN